MRARKVGSESNDNDGDNDVVEVTTDIVLEA